VKRKLVRLLVLLPSALGLLGLGGKPAQADYGCLGASQIQVSNCGHTYLCRLCAAGLGGIYVIGTYSDFEDSALLCACYSASQSSFCSCMFGHAYQWSCAEWCPG
jgi:hypothetical protein